MDSQCPLLIRREIEAHYKSACSIVSTLGNGLREVVDGSKKIRLCDWWLQHIEEKADGLLGESGFRFDALPENYTDIPPSDLQQVEKNLKILQVCLIFFFFFFFRFFI